MVEQISRSRLRRPRLGATSFEDTLARMRRMDNANEVIVRLQAPGRGRPRVVHKATYATNQIVDGAKTVPVTIR